MINSIKDMTLETLLDTCVERSSPQFQSAWTELIHRYKNYVAVIVNRKYYIWNTNHSNVDLSDIINDIINNVFMVLFLDDCSALKLFKARTSEKAFCGYLATITNRLAIRSLKKYLKDGTVYTTTDIQDPKVSEDISWWQFFDYTVNKIRKKAGKNQKFVERDILIFTLYVLEDFSREMIECLPLFKNIGHRVIDNAVIRCKEKFTDNDQSILRELLL